MEVGANGSHLVLVTSHVEEDTNDSTDTATIHGLQMVVKSVMDLM